MMGSKRQVKRNAQAADQHRPSRPVTYMQGPEAQHASVAFDLTSIPAHSVRARNTATSRGGEMPSNLAVGRHDDPSERVADDLAGQSAAALDREMPIAPDGTLAPSMSSSGADVSPSPLSNTQMAPRVVHDALAEPGRPLDTRTRQLFEARFGVDFAGVQVHSGETAQRSAAAVNAAAYTVGQHIVLGAGESSGATREGRRLIAHELTHVVQQGRGGPLVQRQPRDRTSPPLPQFVPADQVREIKRDNETWTLTVDGHTDPAILTRLIFPHVVPAGVTVTLKVGVTDPIERGWFVIDGLTPTGLQVAEPSYRKLFADHGLVEDPPESDELKKAAAAFLDRHSGYSDRNLLNMIRALRRATKRNPELLLAYYKHYATHALTDESRWFDGIDFDPDKHAGGTSGGDTRINARVLNLTSAFPTDDPLSLLASTLIHEYVHTPQGGGDNAVGATPKEAKAYGVEMFFSERMGDRKRAEQISNMDWNSTLVAGTGADKIFWASYSTMKALYEIIDQGGPAAVEARRMTAEFISKNSEDYGQQLRQFIATHP